MSWPFYVFGCPIYFTSVWMQLCPELVPLSWFGFGFGLRRFVFLLPVIRDLSRSNSIFLPSYFSGFLNPFRSTLLHFDHLAAILPGMDKQVDFIEFNALFLCLDWLIVSIFSFDWLYFFFFWGNWLIVLYLMLHFTYDGKLFYIIWCLIHF